VINDLVYLVLFAAVLVPSAVFIGKFMAGLFLDEKTFLTPILKPVEGWIYKISGIQPKEEMGWKRYAFSLILFNFFGFLFLFLVQLAQGILPLNPRHLPGVRWDLALNTAISFMTNTNWQAYGGETTLSYLTQMLGLTVQNFVSAGTGIAVAAALIRGFIRKNTETIGNFWVDLTRSVLYILIPLAIIWTIVLVSQGAVQTLGNYITAQTLEGQKQTLAVGPAASQVAIKQLGSNGGGYFSANSSHPFENPNAITNFFELLAILLLPAAFPFMMGYMMKSRRKGWAIFSAMAVMFAVVLVFSVYYETKGSPNLLKLGVAHGTNMEGKETRFGVFSSVLWGVSTTATSNGSVNSMHDSFLPMTGLFLMLNMLLGEVIFGGVGVGLVGLLFHAFLTMFLAGLMIGRTPEIFNKKLEPFEMIMMMVGIILPGVMVLIFTSVASVLPAGLAGRNNFGPHGFSEIFYAYASALGNNGSAFAGLNANSLFYNLTSGIGMLIGRFATILPALAIAGSLARKKYVADNPATFQTTSPLFVTVLVFVVLVYGALTFFIPFVLGPVLDQLFMNAGRLF
jgi:potassium-transporting ATPase potassium-binding subunit